MRAGRHGRRRAGRLRFADRTDHDDDRSGKLDRRRRSGCDSRVRDEPEPGHQPDAGRSRADRRPARTASPPARLAGDDRSPVHHAVGPVLRANRRRLRLQHRRQHAPQQPDRPVAVGHEQRDRDDRRLVLRRRQLQRRHRLDGNGSDGGPRLAVQPRQLRLDAAAVRQLRRRHGGQLRLRDPERHRGVLPDRSRARRRPDEHPAGSEGDAVQRSIGQRERSGARVRS